MEFPDVKLTRQALREEIPPWGVLVLESHHAPGFTMESRRHDFVKVIYALSGSGIVACSTDEFSFRPRDVVVIPPQQDNRVIDQSDDPASLYVFCLSSNLLQFDRSIVDQMPTGRMRRSPQFANQIERRLRRLLYTQETKSPLRPVRMAADAMQVLRLILEHPVAQERQEVSQEEIDRAEMQAYVNYLHSHFFEATTIDAAVIATGIERRKFTDLFRELTGTTWLEYVRQRAVEHAANLLSNTSIPIASVAFECGFDDLSTFYRRFKSSHGQPPGKYRQSKLHTTI